MPKPHILRVSAPIRGAPALFRARIAARKPPTIFLPMAPVTSRRYKHVVVDVSALRAETTFLTSPPIAGRPWFSEPRVWPRHLNWRLNPIFLGFQLDSAILSPFSAPTPPSGTHAKVCHWALTTPGAPAVTNRSSLIKDFSDLCGSTTSTRPSLKEARTHCARIFPSASHATNWLQGGMADEDLEKNTEKAPVGCCFHPPAKT